MFAYVFTSVYIKSSLRLYMRILFTSIRRFTIFCVYTTVIVLVLVYMCQFSSQYLCIAYVSAYQFYSFCVRIYSYIWIYIYVSILFNDSFVSSLVIQCFPVFIRQRQSESDSSGQHFLFIKTFDYTQLEGKKRPPLTITMDNVCGGKEMDESETGG